MKKLISRKVKEIPSASKNCEDSNNKEAILPSINQPGIWSDFLNHNENVMAISDIKLREIFLKVGSFQLFH